MSLRKPPSQQASFRGSATALMCQVAMAWVARSETGPAKLVLEQGHVALLDRVLTTAQEISIELRRGAAVVKVSWPLAAAADCVVWLRELLR